MRKKRKRVCWEKKGTTTKKGWFHNCLSCVYNCDDQSCLSPQFKYIIFLVFICKNGGRYVYGLTFIVVSANVLKSLSAIAFFISSILLGTHTSDLNCKNRGMKNHYRTLLSWVNVRCGKRHFWVTYLCFKTSPWANPFIWKCVWFAWKWICRGKHNIIWAVSH